MTIRLLLLFFILLFGFNLKAEKTIKFHVIVYNKTTPLNQAHVFVYENGILLKALKTNKKGIIKLSLKYDALYFLSISSAGHITTTLEINTKNATPDEVKQVNLPLELLVFNKQNAQAQNHYRYKWNPIFGEFQTPQLNFGWKEIFYEIPDTNSQLPE